MPSQRVILGIGLAILLMISAASVGLDVKSRSDTAWINGTLEVLNKISEAQLLVRRAESAQRGFALTKDPNLADEFEDALRQVGPTFDGLKAAIRDGPEQTRLLEETEALVMRRLAVASEMMRLIAADDTAAIAALRARGQGRALMESVTLNFDRLIAEQQRALTARTADSRRSGEILLAIDLVGSALILVLVAVMVRGARREKLELEKSLSVARAAQESLEAAAAERTEHLVAAHEELRRSAAILQSTFDSMSEAVLVIDAKGEVLLTNPAAERMFRYRRGMNLHSVRSQGRVYYADGIRLMEPNDMPAARVLRGEQFEEQEFVIRPLSGRAHAPYHIVASGRPLYDATGAISGAAMIYHDITGSRETERQLREAQKLEAVGKLTGGIAHDFNNMLTVITGTNEILVAGLQKQPELLKIAKLIDDAAARGAELIAHLLAFARKQTLQPRDVDINAAIVDVAKLLRPTLGEQIEIITVLGKEAMISHIDPSQLANAVINMAINARDAMPEGGKLLLETRNIVLDQAYADANPDIPQGRYVMVAVSDTGTGMPLQVQDKAFEPFFTTKEGGKGSGLGLSMVYGFVKQSGGHGKIYSEEGHGTTVKLYLPPATGEPEITAEAAPSVAGGNETILVVEDDVMVRNFVISQLQNLGYKPIAAADSRAALSYVESGEPFDLLFTDVVMPGGMSGRELADAVAKQRPGTKVLYTSGYTDDSIVHHGRLDPGVLLLTKPYRHHQLAQMVRLALRGATARS